VVLGVLANGNQSIATRLLVVGFLLFIVSDCWERIVTSVGAQYENVMERQQWAKLDTRSTRGDEGGQIETGGGNGSYDKQQEK
jgi:hypothetical protein